MKAMVLALFAGLLIPLVTAANDEKSTDSAADGTAMTQLTTLIKKVFRTDASAPGSAPIDGAAVQIPDPMNLGGRTDHLAPGQGFPEPSADPNLNRGGTSNEIPEATASTERTH